jgi:phosphatidylserine/phosphatidylglycerophosphate/cardiolipin synthase-like enzyme
MTPAPGERKRGRRRPALEYASLHAKCVVVDERWSLVGSANFTDRAQTRNIEVGALLDDPLFAQALLGQFRGAVAARVLVHWLG